MRQVPASRWGRSRPWRIRLLSTRNARSEEPESGGAAEQMAGVVVTAAPTPRATASVPILPMCLR